MTQAEREARAALRASMEMNGDLMKGERQMAAGRNDNEAKLPRVAIDMKVPLPVILGAVLTLAGGGISMYYKLNSVADAVTDMRATMTSNVAAQAAQAAELTNVKSDLNLLRYRLDKVEAPGGHK